MTRTGGIALGLAALLALTSCANKKPPRDPLESVGKADAQAKVQAQADEIAKLVGKPLQNPKLSSALCLYPKGVPSDGSAYVINGTFQLVLPAKEQAGAAARVRDSWKATGWTITTDTSTDKGVELAGNSPAKFTARLSSGEPAIAFVLLVQSPCYRDPAVAR